MSALSETLEEFTAEDLWNLPPLDRDYELIGGRLRPMTPPGEIHSSITTRFTILVGSHVLIHDLGECFVEVGIVVQRNPDTVLAPDWSFVAQRRLSDSFIEGFQTIIPDMILETRSPHDKPREVRDKIDQWLDAGVKRALELNPKRQELTLYWKDESGSVKSQILGIDDVLTDEELLPGLSLEIRRLFRNS
jgi:Uma2 family endonuclease